MSVEASVILEVIYIVEGWIKSVQTFHPFPAYRFLLYIPFLTVSAACVAQTIQSTVDKYLSVHWNNVTRVKYDSLTI